MDLRGSRRLIFFTLSLLLPLPLGAGRVRAALRQDPQLKLEHLEYTENWGYLPSLLKQLNVPISSQTLVFSKSSFQLSQIAPDAPRAIYFNDDVYVGWVNHGQYIEVASVDPKTGPLFYTLEQEPNPNPKLEPQKEECLICHDTFQTSTPVPRLLMLSVLPNSAGNALKAAALITNDQSPLRERWGGWYVTGTHGKQQHLGNTIVRASADDITDMRKFVAGMNLSSGANITDLSKRFNTKEYLSPHSDIVALMVLGHQTHVHNMITSGAYEIHDAIEKGLSGKMSEVVKDAGERIVRAMMFVGETPLTDPVAGTSSFAADFVKQGPRDKQGRSLRELDLKRRLLRYPLSYLVYSKSFDGMPDVLKDYVYRRFRQILSGEETSTDFAHISEADRKAIFEILKDTKPGF
jgi:hypothetical protein